MGFDEQLAEIAALKLDDVKAFHRDFYGASNAIVSVVGDFDAAAVNGQLAAAFGGWQSKQAYARVPRPVVEVAPADFRIEVKDKQNAVALGKLDLALRESDREYQALRLATQIFGGGGGGSGRLWDRIREKEGLSYGVGAGIAGGQFEANTGWSLDAITAPQNIDKVRAGFYEEMARARRDGFTAAELAAAKSAILASSRLARAQDEALARALISFVERDKTAAYMGELDALRAQITLAEVNAAFRKYVVPEKLVFGVAGDFAAAKGAAAKPAQPTR